MQIPRIRRLNTKLLNQASHPVYCLRGGFQWKPDFEDLEAFNGGFEGSNERVRGRERGFVESGRVREDEGGCFEIKAVESERLGR